MQYIVWMDKTYSPIREVVEEIDGTVFFGDTHGEKCVANKADIPYIAQSEQDTERFPGIPTNLQLIPNYAKNVLPPYETARQVQAVDRDHCSLGI